MRAALLFAGLMSLMPSAFAVMHHIEIVSPRAGQQGTVVEVTLEGGFLKEAREVLFFRPGIKCTEVKVLPSLKERRVMFAHGGFIEDKVLCRFEISPDCPLGLHPFKVRTSAELSTLSTFVVTAFPVVDEGEDKQGGNDTLKTAKPIPINTTVRGRITNSHYADVDMYRVAGKAGSHLSVEVDSVRISEKHYGDSEFDLMVRLLDSDGKELARNDDSALHLQDPIISTILPKDGDYFVEIKQRLYSSGGWTYLAHIGNNTRPLAVFPAGGPAGKPLQANLMGDPSGDMAKTIDLPPAEGDFDFFNGMPSPLPMRVSNYDNVLYDRNATETHVKSLPVALNGIIAKPGEIDSFRLPAKKGERWRVRVYARSLGSPLDPRISIHRVGSDSGEIEEDDAPLHDRGIYSLAGRIQRKEMMDPSIVWEPKEDGDYVLSVDDMRGFSDPLALYRIEIEAVRDEVNTFIASRGADGGDYPRLMSIVIPQGNRWTQTVHIAEGQGNRYRGELELEALGLPKGVTMIAPRVPKGAKQAQVQFVADATTPPQVALISILCKAADGTPLISHSQQGFAFINHSGGAAWNSFFVDHYALAVTEPAPFSVELVQPQIPLSKNGELAVQIKIARKPGFNDPLEVQCDWLPPSVGCEPVVMIDAGQSEAVLHLSAESSAQPGTSHLAIPMSTTGNGDYELGRVRASSGFIDLVIAEPYVVLKNHPGSVRRGATAQVSWDVENKKPFEGEADAILLGLPKGVSVVGATKLKSGAPKLVFEISATDEALMGQYKELACEIVVKEHGQEIRQRSGKGILRVDPALPSKKTSQATVRP